MIASKPLHVVGIGGTLRPRSTSRFALERALTAAVAAGATTELLALHEIDLPMYRPDFPLEAYNGDVAHFVDIAQRADAMIWSSAGYHGTLAGVTKNALDFLEFLAHNDPPYLHNRVVGLIATAGGELAAVNTVNAMVHTVHALRGTVAPLFVAIPKANQVWDKQGNILNERWAARLDQLGALVVDTARRLQPFPVEEELAR